MMHCNRIINSTSLRLLFFCSVGQPERMIAIPLITIISNSGGIWKTVFFFFRTWVSASEETKMEMLPLPEKHYFLIQKHQLISSSYWLWKWQQENSMSSEAFSYKYTPGFSRAFWQNLQPLSHLPLFIFHNDAVCWKIYYCLHGNKRRETSLLNVPKHQFYKQQCPYSNSDRVVFTLFVVYSSQYRIFEKLPSSIKCFAL